MVIKGLKRIYIVKKSLYIYNVRTRTFVCIGKKFSMLYMYEFF